MTNRRSFLRLLLVILTAGAFTSMSHPAPAFAQHGPCTQYKIEIDANVNAAFFPLFLSVSFWNGTPGSEVSVPHTFNGPTTQTFNNPPGKSLLFVDILGQIVRDDGVSHVIHLFPGGPCIAVTVLTGPCPNRIIIQGITC